MKQSPGGKSASPFGILFRLRHWRWLLRRPTIVFAIPLRSRVTSADWRVECSNLRRTVRSCLSQKNARPMIVIAGHEMPEFLRQREFAGVVFMKADFPPPDDASAYMADKLRKKIFAATASRALGAGDCLFMYVDGDDLLHPRLFDVACRSLAEHDDLILDVGYLVDMKHHTVSLLNAAPPFHKVCGTCLVSKICQDDLPLPNKPSTFIGRLHDHTKYLEVSQKHNRRHTASKTPLVAYLVNHGNNNHSNNIPGSGSRVENLARKYLVEERIRREMLDVFCLTLPPADRHSGAH